MSYVSKSPSLSSVGICTSYHSVHLQIGVQVVVLIISVVEDPVSIVDRAVVLVDKKVVFGVVVKMLVVPLIVLVKAVVLVKIVDGTVVV